ncbi:MAG: hypothetical protein S0880_33660 [Actinomycetota bacterium]|nr:hypothetical protein [Actinomycetota bacterium]
MPAREDPNDGQAAGTAPTNRKLIADLPDHGVDPADVVADLEEGRRERDDATSPT